ncbi:MAG: hypothetical protein H3C31_08000 [Brumimicrobium sp.]|nr:hypothetical protein [Brumimicrobium sp.]
MKKASVLMIIGSTLLLSLFIFPLWNIELLAPQYPKGLGMHIFIDGLEGYTEHDLMNIDGLNHYIGMQTLPEKGDMWEFTTFPIIIAIMALIGILIGIVGFFKHSTYKWFMGWFVVMSVLGILGMYDFNQWLVDYGSNLDPHAIIKVVDDFGNPMSYKPPLLGTKDILNFTAISLPGVGGYLMGIGMFLIFISFFIGRKAAKKENLSLAFH